MEQTNTLKWVTAARVVGDYLLELDFNDGRRVIFDCLPLISQYKLFAPLRDKVQPSMWPNADTLQGRA